MTWTRAGAFAQVGVRLRNNQWSWSGRSEDGQTVAVMTTAKDDKANPREVERCYPVTDQRRLQLVDVDYETGAHVAKMVTV